LELATLFRILLRRWWLVLIPVAITAALALPEILNRRALSGGYSAGVQYSAFQSIEAIPRTDGDYQDIWLSSELTVNAFADWIRSGSFKQEIAARLSGDFDVAPLTIAADNERSLGTISFYHPEEEALNSIVAAAVDVLQTRSNAYFAQLGGAPAAVTILDQSPAVPAPPPLVDRYAPFLRVGLGLLAGIGLALLAHYLDPVVRQREELESLGLPVIASIPKY
jgi:capsular polysaccharide biosynthesis protein